MLDLAYFDFLSPRITLYQRGRIRHSSYFSGMLTLISYLICVLSSIYFSLDVIKHKKPQAYFYKSFFNETGIFTLDTKGLFHFIQFMNSELKMFPYNSRYIRIKGVRDVFYYSNPTVIENQDHWIYDTCDSSISLNNLQEHLHDIIGNFSGGACLKYFYNSTDKKYYKIDADGFSPPYLIHGNSRPDNLYYSLIIEKCRNNSIDHPIYGNESCANEEEMDLFYDYFIAVYLQIVDYNVDINNYKTPIKSILYPISTGVQGNNFASHNLNFSPLIFKSHSNLFFSKLKEYKAFSFDVNRKNTKENSDVTKVYCEFIFWIQNTFQIYERFYKNISDVLANVGGIFEVIITFSSWINFYYHRYMIRYDSILLFGDKENNVTYNSEKQIKKKDIMSSNLKNYGKFIQTSILGLNQKNDLSISNQNSKIFNLKNDDVRIKTNNFFHISNVSTFRNVKNNDVNNDFKLTFFSYILRCKNISQMIVLNIIENFRKKLLSEEHLYRNHIDLYFLEKYFNLEKKEKIDINEIYKRL